MLRSPPGLTCRGNAGRGIDCGHVVFVVIGELIARHRPGRGTLVGDSQPAGHRGGCVGRVLVIAGLTATGSPRTATPPATTGSTTGMSPQHHGSGAPRPLMPAPASRRGGSGSAQRFGLDLIVARKAPTDDGRDSEADRRADDRFDRLELHAAQDVADIGKHHVPDRQHDRRDQRDAKQFDNQWPVDHGFPPAPPRVFITMS